MNIITNNNNLIIKNVCDFNIEEILECGQCFNFIKIDEKEYRVVAMGKALHIKQEDDIVTFYNTTKEEYDHIWHKYFDMDNDYSVIKNRITQYDNRLEGVVKARSGVRIIKQNFFETLISFIISQNKQIPHIKQIISTISKNYGDSLVLNDNETYYSFPSVEQLNKITEEELRACKVGFRAPYIKDACNKVFSGEIVEEDLIKMTTEEARIKLMTIKGVGEKVANCVLLFGLNKMDTFPVDVWMKRVMEEMYFNQETKKEIIEAFAMEKFQDIAGYAQQYLFYYARDNKIGK